MKNCLNNLLNLVTKLMITL